MELKPVQDYTEADLDYNNRDSRVYREHDDASLRDIPLVKDKADNWEGYDTVFIGYPIWWGIAAWPVDTFVKHNDFSGKTVIPFATSASSGLGDSGRQLQQMAGTGRLAGRQAFPVQCVGKYGPAVGSEPESLIEKEGGCELTPNC